jgi:phage shock protein A
MTPEERYDGLKADYEKLVDLYAEMNDIWQKEVDSLHKELAEAKADQQILKTHATEFAQRITDLRAELQALKTKPTPPPIKKEINYDPRDGCD